MGQMPPPAALESFLNQSRDECIKILPRPTSVKSFSPISSINRICGGIFYSNTINQLMNRKCPATTPLLSFSKPQILPIYSVLACATTFSNNQKTRILLQTRAITRIVTHKVSITKTVTIPR